MFSDWSFCIEQAAVFGESLCYTTYDYLENAKDNQSIRIDGLLITGIREARSLITDLLIDRRTFEKLSMVIVNGDQEATALKRVSKFFHRSISLDINHKGELVCCILDNENNYKCNTVTELQNCDLLMDIPQSNKRKEKQALRVTRFRLDPAKRPAGSYNFDNALVRLVDKPLVQKMASMLNLIPKPVGDYASSGNRLANGTFTGALGEIEYGRSDLANSRIISHLRGATNIRFLHPITITSFKFIVPKNYYKHPKREVRIIALPVEFVVAYVCSLLWIPLGFILFEYWGAKVFPNEHNSRTSWMTAVFVTYSAMTNISIAIRNISSQRIYWMSFIWFQLITYSVFQGNMINEVNRAANNRDIQTVQELLESTLDLRLHSSMATYFSFDERTIIKYNLTKRIQWVDDQPDKELSDLVAERSFAALYFVDLIEDIVPQFYDKRTGEDLLYVIPETVYEFYCAMTVPVGSPYVEPFNYISMQFVESGLIAYALVQLSVEARLAYVRRYRNRNFAPPALRLPQT
ncbi:uncharacterized protein LOC134207259 [Armigeres subalbatus]|uniref:uncharacterized protein LOC134207259 n=1 Tax=Armigeres subalbatus TaxID=124917 RepID=UPI002ED6761D